MRHTLVGVTLDLCTKKLPRVTTSLLSEPVLNWVIAIMEERCRECGIMNDDPGATLNHYPWIAAIKEKAVNVDGKSSKTLFTLIFQSSNLPICQSSNYTIFQYYHLLISQSFNSIITMKAISSDLINHC